MTEFLTTGEAARICGVSFRTVIRWIERGLLQAHKLPGRGDHRVPMEDLRRFMRENGMPDPMGEQRASNRILIADDEPNMARAIERVLAKAGFETALAGNGFESGVLLHSLRPALMTLDLRMPGMDGFAVLRFLEHTPLPFETKVLVVSGESETRLQEALALGAHGVLRKPFENAALLAEVERLIGLPRQAERLEVI